MPQDSPAELAHQVQSCTTQLQAALVTIEQLTQQLHQVQQAQRELERKFQAVFEQTFQFTGLLTPEGIVVEANQSAVDFAGVERVEIVNCPFWEVHSWMISPKTQEQLKQAIAQAATGEFVRYEVDVLGKNNTIITLDFSLKPVQDDTGQVILLIAEGRDITQLKQAQKQELNQQTTTILESITDGFVAIDSNWCLTYLNPSAKSLMVKKTPDQVIGKNVWQVYPEAVNTWLYHELHRVATERVTVCTEGVSPITNRWLQVCVYPAKDGLSIYFRNISQQKAAEHERNELRQQRDRFFDLCLDMLVIANFDGYFTHVNPAWERTLGFTLAELTDQPFWDLVHPEDVEVTQAAMAQLALGLPLTTFENRYRCKDGDYKWLCWQAVPFLEEKLIYAAARDVTERKLTETALWMSEERFSITFHCNPIASSIYTFPEGRILDVNKSWLELFGYSQDEVLGRTTIELEIWYSLDDRATTIQRIEQAGAIHNLEFKFRTKLGEIRDGLASVEVIDLHGERCILVMLLDISERKQIEAALAYSEQKYRNLVETSQGMIWSLDTEGRFTFVNHAVRHLFGYEPEQMLGCRFVEFIATSEQIQETWKAFERILAGESIFQYEIECVHKDGIPFYLSTNAIVLRDDTGNVLGATGTAVDITYLKQAEAALRTSEVKLRTILDSAVAVITSFRVFANQDWEYQYVSSGVEVLYGYTAEEFMANKMLWISQVVPEDLNAVILPAYEDIFAERTTKVEFRFLHKDGTVRWFSMNMFSQRDEANNCWLVTTVDIDISERKQAEEKLQASLREKEALLKEVHHRVKNNLQVISSLLDLQAQYIQEPKALEAFRESQNRVRSIGLIHEKLYQSNSLAQVNLADYIRSLTTHLIQSYALNPHTITLQLKLDDVLCTLDTAIPCGLLLNELISNALKHGFSQANTGNIWVELNSVTVTTDQVRQHVTLVVGNDGRELADLPNFEQAKSLGLQLIYVLAQQLKGQIEIAQSRGTEFKIRFINGMIDKND